MKTVGWYGGMFYGGDDLQGAAPPVPPRSAPGQCSGSGPPGGPHDGHAARVADDVSWARSLPRAPCRKPHDGIALPFGVTTLAGPPVTAGDTTAVAV